MKKKNPQTFMNKPVYLDLPILELSRIVMYEFWYDYIKPKHGKKSQIMLHGYRQTYSLHKNKRHLLRDCER